MTLEEQILDILQLRKSGIRANNIVRILKEDRAKVDFTLNQLRFKQKCKIDNDQNWSLIQFNRDSITKSSNDNDKKIINKTTSSLEKQIKEENKFYRKFKRPQNISYKPKSSSAEDLFEYAIKYLAEVSQKNDSVFEPKMHLQWSNFCFKNSGSQPWQYKEYMSAIKSTFRPYFIGDTKYTFDIDTIERDFPQFFEEYEKEPRITEMTKAVKSELEFAKDPRNKKHYKVESIDKLPNTNKIYCIALYLKDDNEFHFYEGIKIRLKIGSEYYNCEGLDYDAGNDILFINSEKPINNSKTNQSRVLYVDSSFILDALYDQMLQLPHLKLDDLPIEKFLEDNTKEIKQIDVANISSSISKDLDSSQKKAYLKSLENDITFIWGPPGTGKSYTLASIIRALYTLEEKTLVCCISNIAVDQLLNKVIYSLKEEAVTPKPGQLYRAGRTMDTNVIATDYLFPKDEQTKQYRNKLEDISKNLKTMTFSHQKSSSEYLTFKQEQLDILEKLKEHTEYLISQSHIIFSTISNFILTPGLYNRKFDNIIVDEASMLSMPYLMAIAQRVFKRIILVGDPQQLGPISITPNKWLRQNIFDYCQVIQSNSPALQQLLVQRRSHPKIVRLINNIFYKGKLEAVQNNHPNWVEKAPFAGSIVHVVNKGIPDNEVAYAGSTRRNFGTCNKVMSILEEYFQNNDDSFTIGVITPYKGQVKLYLAAIRDKQNGNGFWESIKVGTIHTFQGSECDLIIIDLVEKSPTPVSKLFDHEPGEQLINVALSRARNKLIIVGDTERFRLSTGTANVSLKVSQVMSNLR